MENVMKQKGVMVFVVLLNIIGLVYGCVSMMWSSWNVGVLLGSVLNVVSVFYLTYVVINGSQKGRIAVYGITILIAVYATIYFVFENAITPLSLVIGGSFYGIAATIMEIMGQDIEMGIHSALGVGFAILFVAMTAMILWARRKPRDQ